MKRSTISRSLLSFLLMGAIVGAVPRRASAAGAWSKPANVSSTRPDNYGTAVAIDPNGNAVAVSVGLVQMIGTVTDIFAVSLAPGGAWTAPEQISSTGRAGVPVLRMDTAGNASAAWTSFLDTQIAEKPAGGPWAAAQSVAPIVMDAQFLMNSRGDQALVWTTSAPLGLDISVMRKPAGAPWGPTQRVVAGNAATIFVLAGRAALGDGGDLVVPFEYFRLYCPPPGGCHNIGWTQQAARQGAGGSGWEISSTLVGPDNSSHSPAAALNASGAAAVVYRKGAALYATSQAGAGQAWTAPAPIYSATKLTFFGLAADGTGVSTVFALDNGNVIAIDGDPGVGLWSPGVTISGTDASATRVVFSVAPGGAAIAAWNGPFSGSKNAVRAAIRTAGATQWNLPQSASPMLVYAMPDSAGINPSGQAIVGFHVSNTSYSRAAMVAMYTP